MATVLVMERAINLFTYIARDRIHDRDVLKVLWPSDPNLMVEGGAVVDFLGGLRKRAAKEHQGFAAEKKACAQKGMIDAARWYRDLTADAQKRLRAVRLWLGHFDPKACADAPWIEFWDWPVDLAPEIYDVAREIGLWAREQ